MAGDITASWDVNLFFSSQDAEGWSEHYIVKDTSSADMGALIGTLCNLRKALLGVKFQIDGARLSDIAIHGDSYPVIGTTFPLVGTFAPVGSDPTIGNTALKVRLLADPPYRGLIYMRGLDEAIVSGRHYVGDTDFNVAFSAYASHLTDASNQYQINVETPPGSGLMSMHSISTVAIYGVTSRKVGRPFGLPVGHRRRRVVASTSVAKRSISSGVVTPPPPGSPPAPLPSRSTGSSSPRARR